ncbi:hypothetical protein V2W45_886460 [Cenococcum geophilum]
MLAHAPRISDCFLRYEHHRNRSSLCLFARRQSHFPIVIRTTACSPFRYCPGCQCPSQVPNPHLFQALPERWRRHTQSQHSTCAQGVLKLVSSFFQSAHGHADVAAPPPLSLHLFAHIFTNLHCPRALLPSPVPHPSPRTCSEPGSPLCFGSHSPELAALVVPHPDLFVSRCGALFFGQWDSFHGFYQDCCTPVFSRHANASPLLLTLLRGLFCALRDENHCCRNHH